MLRKINKGEELAHVPLSFLISGYSELEMGILNGDLAYTERDIIIEKPDKMLSNKSVYLKKNSIISERV